MLPIARERGQRPDGRLDDEQRRQVIVLELGDVRRAAAVVSIVTGNLVYFWPIWVAGPWAVVNVGLMILFPPGRRT